MLFYSYDTDPSRYGSIRFFETVREWQVRFITKKLYDFRVWLITRKWVRINVGFLKHDDYDDEAAHDKYLYDCVLHDSLWNWI